MMKLIKGYGMSIMTIAFLGCSHSKQKLVFEEDFLHNSLNGQIWNFELGDGCPNLCGWGNNEPQIYTTSNHRVQDGNLVISVKKEDSTYTSTRITTKDKFDFRYGRVEARMKLPSGTGVWPAFWLLGSNINEVGWPQCGEIDIMEYVGREPGQIFNSLHTKSSHGNTINTKKTKIDGVEEGFHVYGIDWSKDKIDFFVDGKKSYSYAPANKNNDNWPFDQPYYLLLNVAVGGNFGGPVIDDEIFPQEFIVDYIRIFEN